MLLKPLELEIPSGDPFANDSLGRKPVVEALTSLIQQVSGPFVIAIDSPWGTGKSTFLKMLKTVLESAGHPCLNFNAWETDFAEDPLIAFVGEMDVLLKSICPDESSRRESIDKTKRLAGAVAKRVIPAAIKVVTVGALDLSAEAERVIADAAGGLAGDAVDSYLKEKELIKEFHSQINLALAVAAERGKKLPVVILVDEVDRCRPSYAIDLLERIKHLFNVENAVFVVAIDKEQLGISLGAVYGQGFDSSEYLRRFFDLELRLAQVDSRKFCDALIRRMQVDQLLALRPTQTRNDDEVGLKDCFRAMSNLLGLTPRAQERYMGLLTIALSTTPNNHYLFPVEISIFAALKIGAESTYLRVSRENASVVEIIELLRERKPREADYIGRYWEVLVGVLLRMRDRDDARANQLVAEYGNAVRAHAEQDGASGQGEGVERIHRIATSTRGFGDPSIKFVVQRIDIAAQFSEQ